MAKSYRKETENKYNNKIDDELSNLPEFVNDYNEHIKLSVEASSRFVYITDIRQFFEYVSENMEIDIKSITPDILENLSVNYLSRYLSYNQKYEKNGSINTNENITIKRKLTAIRNLYAYLYNMDIIQINPTLKLETPKIKQKNISRLDDEETRQFLEIVEHGYGLTGKRLQYHLKYGKRDYTILALMLGTGIRVSECVGLNIQDVNLKNHSIKIIRKGNKEDIVYYSDKLTEILREYIFIYRKPIIPIEGHEDALFYSTQRKRMGVRSIELMIEKYALESGVAKHVTPHLLRRSFGSKLYNETGDLYLVSSTLGHSSVETTKRHYAAISEQHKIENRNAIELP